MPPVYCKKEIMIRKYWWLILTYLFKWRFYHLGSLSYIGRPNYLINPQKIYIGSRVRILNNFRCEVHGLNRLVIEDGVSIGHNVHISVYDSMTIKENCVISSNVFIGSLDHKFTHPKIHIMNQGLAGAPVTIGAGTFIGTGVAILSGTVIGPRCVVGANSVVRGRVEAGSIIAGNPAKLLSKLDY